MPIKKILITGGAGYIGSHMVLSAKRAGYEPIVLDDLSSGHRDAVVDAELVVGSIHDLGLLTDLFALHSFSAVMHFASFIEVGESVLNPAKYYHNNVSGTLNLLQAVLNAGIKYFIFSSSAAVYGEPASSVMDESHRVLPINPYGISKAMIEQVLQDYAASYDFQFSALRYFNAAGADPSGRLGERHEPETHLIPLVLQTAAGLRKSISVFGKDYPTPDGTCVRDYVHVADICEAHLLALEKLWGGGGSSIYNLGTGVGYSVQEVIEVVRSVTGKDVPVVEGNRRAGDPAVLVADAGKAMRELGWVAKYSALTTIVESAWAYYSTYNFQQAAERAKYCHPALVAGSGV